MKKPRGFVTTFLSVSVTAAAVLTLGVGCKDRTKEAEQAAEKAAQAEAKRKAMNDDVKPAEVIKPPIVGRKNVPCDKLINAADFTAALGETDPLVLKDNTSTNADAAATCSLHRGGTPLTEEQQKALLKKQPRLGVLPGDEVCRIGVYCWTLESEQGLREKCSKTGRKDDFSTGGYGCVQVVAQGVDDVHSYQLFDSDTKCLIEVKGGPSMVDNEFIAKCGKLAREKIGPEQIDVGGDDAAAPAAP